MHRAAPSAGDERMPDWPLGRRRACPGPPTRGGHEQGRWTRGEVDKRYDVSWLELPAWMSNDSEWPLTPTKRPTLNRARGAHA